jgi:signal transduction histidine kinase
VILKFDSRLHYKIAHGYHRVNAGPFQSLTDRDLYTFRFNLSDGKYIAVAGPNSNQVLGTDVRTTKDPTGKVFGPELYAAAQKPEGEITEVNYLWPRPGSDKTPVAKVSFVTKAGDLGCSVGYYA